MIADTAEEHILARNMPAVVSVAMESDSFVAEIAVLRTTVNLAVAEGAAHPAFDTGAAELNQL